ncbi:hypothetical protein L345_13431, partial [Ophiophagus hannah]
MQQESSYWITSLFHARIKSLLFTAIIFSELLLLQNEKLPFPFEHFLQRIARRPRPQQFYGLMGKRDAEYTMLNPTVLIC